MRRLLAGLTAAVALLLTGSLVSVPGSVAATANQMAGRKLGVTTQTDRGNQVYVEYTKASGLSRALLSRTALRSRARWYGAWTGTGAALQKVLRGYIANVQKGDPKVVVPLATFRMWPRGEGDRKAFSAADRAAYKSWYANAAKAIGSTRTVVVFEPDLPLVLPRHGTADTDARLALARDAVAKLAALPNTAVYIDTGSADWLSAPESVSLLRRAGIAKARGFSLGATYYDSTTDNIAYSRQLGLALRDAGIAGKKSVIDTADNGRPFTYEQYQQLLRKKARRNHFDNADVCVNRSQTQCNTLGIPPTTDVANARWRHSATVSAWARAHVDAYLWFGRPWLRMQASPYCRSRAMQVGRTTPWATAVPQLSAATVRAQQASCFHRP